MTSRPLRQVVEFGRARARARRRRGARVPGRGHGLGRQANSRQANDIADRSKSTATNCARSSLRWPRRGARHGELAQFGR